MKILAVTNLYPNPYQPHRAPYNRHQFRMLAELHELRVIAPIAWADEWADRGRHPAALPPSRRVIKDGLIIDHPRYWYTPKIFRRLYGQFFLASVRRTFARAATEFSPDVIFAPWAYPDGYAAVVLGRQFGLPVVVQVHGSDIRQLAHFPSRLAGTAAAVREATGVIAVCRELADRVIALGASPENVRVILDGVDRRVFFPGCQNAARNRLGLRSEQKHLLFVGNLVSVKGIDILLEACRCLPAACPRWQLHIVGEGPERAALTALAQSLGVDKQVVFHGSMSQDRLPDWYRAADLFLLASRSEGVPNVLLEAAACGLPFVASAVGGIPEIAGIGASRLVPPEDPLLLVQAMAEMLAQPTPPPSPPRDRRDAVAEIAHFLQSRCDRRTDLRPIVATAEAASR